MASDQAFTWYCPTILVPRRERSTQASTIDGTQGQGGATEAWADAWRRIEDEARGVGSFVA